MTGPGGQEVGRVSIRVAPNTDGFRRELQNAVREAEAGTKVEIPAEIKDLDTAGLRAQLEALEQSKVTIPAEIGDGTEIERLRARLEALDNARITIPVDFDLKGIERAEAVVRRLDGRSIKMTVRLNNVRQVIRDLTVLDALVRRLDGRRININVDVDSGAALAQIAAIEAALVGVRASLGTVRAASSGPQGAFGGITSGALTAAAALVLLPPLAAGLAAAGAAVTAAWGAVSTAILAVPPAIALLAAPIAAAALGMDGIERAAKKIKPQFDKLKAAVSGTFEKFMTPVFRDLATKLFPTLTTHLQNTARAVSFVAQSLTNMLTSAPGLALIGKTFENINFALLQIHPGLESVVQSFLLLGSQRSIFDALVKGINTFGEELRRSVIDLIVDGTLDRAMRGLGDSLAALSRGFVSLVENGMRVFASAAPGVNKFLDSLTKFFNRFNWDSLGKSVGRVFEGLASALDKVPTDTFRKIEEAFAKLGETFNDPAFQQGITDLINSFPAAIELVDKLARALGPLGTEIGNFITDLNNIGAGAETGLQKLKDLSDWIDTQLFGEPIEVPEEWKSPLQKWIEGWLGDDLPGKAEQQGKDVGNAFQRGLDSIEPQFGAIGDGWLPDIAGWLKDLFSPDDTTASDFMNDLETQIRDGLTRVTEAGRQGMEQVKLIVQTGLAQLPLLASTAMIALQTAFTNGFLALGAVTSLAMNTLVNTLTLGFVNLQTAAANGMLLLQQAIVTGFTLVQPVVDAGILAIQTAFTNAFLQIQTDAANGMLLFAAAVLAGFAVVIPAFTVGMTQITLAVQVGFQQIVSAVQTGMQQIVTAVQVGMQQVTAALQLNWSAAVAATQAASDQMTAVVQLAMVRIAEATRAGMQQMQNAVTAGMSIVRVEVERGMRDSEAAVKNGITRMVGALRAAVGQFRSAGANMGQALADGLLSKLGAVQAAANRLAQAAAAAVRAAAAIRSPSRVFLRLGSYMGEGLELGLADSRSAIISEARAIVDGLKREFDRADLAASVGTDSWATDLNARVNASLAELDAVPADATQGQGTVINNNFYTESATRESAAVAQVQRRQAALGLFG